MRGAEPLNPATSPPVCYLNQRSRRQAQAGLPECLSSGQRQGRSGLGVPLPCSSSSTVLQHLW